MSTERARAYCFTQLTGRGLNNSLAYAEHFTFSQVQTSELGFCLSTFKAALALMTESRLLNRNR